MNENLQNVLLNIIKEDQILYEEPMRLHTTFRVGGPAKRILIPNSEKEAVALLRLFSDYKEPCFLLGNGSNLLVSDLGYRGTVILLEKNYSTITIDKEKIYAQAGALLVKIASMALQESLTGMEFASGIPGTLGGAVTMNAGAYGGEMKDIISTVRLFDPKTGSVREVPGEQMHFSYRSSIVEQENAVVLGATLLLKKGDRSAIRERMEELKEQRITKQPLEYASAGSTFKRPEGAFAGRLIEEAGMKGYRVGNAMVSDKHAGFVINTGEATAEEIITVIRDVRKRVFEHSGILLEPEVRMLGEGLAL